MPTAATILLWFWLGVSLLSVGVTVFDKHRARKGRYRVRERTLLLLAAAGGGSAMLATMLVIRHKTRKPKFMVGIPLIILCHLLLIALWARYSGVI